jgi:hypothetical protein
MQQACEYEEERNSHRLEFHIARTAEILRRLQPGTIASNDLLFFSILHLVVEKVIEVLGRGNFASPVVVLDFASRSR